MKLYNGMSPNGARVAVFLAEKGLKLETQNIDILKGEARTDSFREINSLGQVPVLELDNGDKITESVAICRYLEELHPEPALFGNSTQERAFVEMWNRRMELILFNTVGSIGLHELELFKDTHEQFGDYAGSLRRQLPGKFSWLNKEMGDGRQYIVGNTFSVADITGMAMLLASGFMKITIPAELEHVKRWEMSMYARESFPKFPG